MRTEVKRPIFDRDEYYESSARIIRWIVMILVAVTFPFDSQNGLAVITILSLIAIYNGLRYLPGVLKSSLFSSRINSLAIDHLFVLGLVYLSGGLASPYYPLFFLLIISTIASYGIAGFAFSLSSQVALTLILLRVDLTPQPGSSEYQLIIKLILLIVFSLVAEQSVRSHNEEYLLESRFSNRIENERQRLLALINSLSNAVLAVDEHGKIYLYNAAALELLNTNQDITGNSVNDLLPLRGAHGQRVHFIHLVREEGEATNRQDLYITASDGTKMMLDLTVTPVYLFGAQAENSGGYMIVFRDITKQKTLDEERDEFISVTSHELRTPLAIAEANLSTALLPKFAKIDPKARTLVEQAHTNIMFLSELIADLTTLSRAERADLKPDQELVNVPALIEQLGQDYTEQAKAKHLTLSTSVEGDVQNVYSSRQELQEILQNFITNALKYTTSGGVTITAAQAATGVQISVHDTGIGISATDKAKLFTKFYRSEDYRTRQTGGTGLGLYITRKLGDKLGVPITFASRLNHGSTFTVTIPPATNIEPTPPVVLK